MLNSCRAALLNSCRAKLEEQVDVDLEELIYNFSKAASILSECGSAKKGGDLGIIRRGGYASSTKNRMQEPIEEIAFDLSVGQLSEVVETKSGVHLILRIELGRSCIFRPQVSEPAANLALLEFAPRLDVSYPCC